MIRSVLGSTASMAIVPMQDVLGLDSSARMNTPGTIESNWNWRLAESMDLKESGEKLKALTALYNR